MFSPLNISYVLFWQLHLNDTLRRELPNVHLKKVINICKKCQIVSNACFKKDKP